jgi:hypothetical protein
MILVVGDRDNQAANSSPIWTSEVCGEFLHVANRLSIVQLSL